jgi:Fe-S cluster assembly ATP-binding protein
MLYIKNLVVEVKGKQILNNVNLEVPDGEVHLLLGPNGCGKTSLLMTIMGYHFYRVVRGEMMVDGQDIVEASLLERARSGIGLLEQRPPTISGVKLCTLLEYIFKRHPDKKEELREFIRNAGMEAFLDRSVNDGLSGGEMKRLELLLLSARSPLLAMLDEPDSGVDIESLDWQSQLIGKLFSQKGSGTRRRTSGLIVSHSRAVVSNVKLDKAHVMLQGTIVCSGSPRRMLEQVMESGFGSCAICRGEKRLYGKE